MSSDTCPQCPAAGHWYPSSTHDHRAQKRARFGARFFMPAPAVKFVRKWLPRRPRGFTQAPRISRTHQPGDWCAPVSPGPGPTVSATRPASDAAYASALAEDPRDQQDDDGADDRSEDASRVQREQRHAVEEHQVLQEAPDEGTYDPETHGPEQAHRVPAGYHQPGDGPCDQAHNQQEDYEPQHVTKDTPVLGCSRPGPGAAGPGGRATGPVWRRSHRCATVQSLAPSSSGLGRRPLKAVAPVQIRSGLLGEVAGEGPDRW